MNAFFIIIRNTPKSMYHERIKEFVDFVVEILEGFRVLGKSTKKLFVIIEVDALVRDFVDVKFRLGTEMAKASIYQNLKKTASI